MVSEPWCELEPPTITHALKHPTWRQAMQEEFDALTRNHTWSLVPSIVAPNLVGYKWVSVLNMNWMAQSIILKAV